MSEPVRNPSGEDIEPDAGTVQRAAEWHALLQDVEADAADHEACVRWQATHPAHAEAFARLSGLWARFDEIRERPARHALRRALTTRESGARARGAKGLALVLLVAGLAWLGLGAAPPDYWLADHRTGVGEVETLRLDDASRVTLNTHAAIDVAHGPARREITLHQGEIAVRVAADDDRPFVVRVPQGTIMALGTEFVVRRAAGRTHVAVLESRVRVCPRAVDTGPQCRVLAAGETGNLGERSASRTGTVNPATAAAWVRGELVVDDRPLPEVLDELARYRRAPILYRQSELRAIRVSGVYPIADPARALEALAASLPLHVRHYGPWLTAVDLRR